MTDSRRSTRWMPGWSVLDMQGGRIWRSPGKASDGNSGDAVAVAGDCRVRLHGSGRERAADRLFELGCSRTARVTLSSRFGGVKLAGGEFQGKRLTGRHGFGYAYRDARAAAPFVHAGFDAVRVPVRWERRLQPVAATTIDAREMEPIDRSLERLDGFRVVIIDVHNYERYRGQRLNGETVPGAMLADLWTRLA